jgi:hypothetical protein
LVSPASPSSRSDKTVLPQSVVEKAKVGGDKSRIILVTASSNLESKTMRKLTSSLILLTITLITCRADVVIYKGAQMGRQIGNGPDQRFTTSTFVVVDTDTNQIQVITANKVNGQKVFNIATQSIDWVSVLGPNGQTYSGFPSFDYAINVIGQTTNANLVGFSLCYGKLSALTINSSSGRTVNYPRSMTGKPQGIITDSSGWSTILDSSLILVFNQKMTQDANAQGKTASMVVQQIQQDLIGRFYKPQVPPVQ